MSRHLPGWSFFGITWNGLHWRRERRGWERTSDPIRSNRLAEIIVDHRRVFARRFHVPSCGYERSQTRDKPRAKTEPKAVLHRMQGQFPMKRRKI